MANLVYGLRAGRSRNRLISLGAKPRHRIGGATTVLLSAALVAGVGIFGANPAEATTMIYASTAGTGTVCTSSSPCSLTEALSSAASGDSVELYSGTYTGNFNLPSVTVEPVPGQTDAVQLNGGGVIGTSVVAVESGINATLENITVTNGDGAWGGAIYNVGTLTVIGSTISDSTATGGAGGRHYGGGIYNDGTLTVETSTIADNTATGDAGGGIFNDVGGVVSVDSSTLTGNVAGYAGGGIYNYDGTLTVKDSTISDNTATLDIGGGILNGGGTTTVESSTLSGDTAGYAGAEIGNNVTLAGDIIGTPNGPPSTGECFGSPEPSDDGYNVSDDASCNLTTSTSINSSPTIDAYLGSLGANGGPTQTVPLLASSSVIPSPGPDPALTAIPSSFILPTGESACSDPDQRGAPRSAPCDMGAFELASTTTTLGASTTSPVVGEQVTYTATVSPTPDGGSVTFYDGGNPITCTNSGGQTVTSGQATCEYTYETTSGSPHSITATYSGDTNFSESSTTSATSVTVGEASTTTTLGASTTSPVVGEQVTYTATVSPTPDGGSVTFYDGGNPITCTNSGGQTVTSGQATCEYTYETTSGSPHSITATYSGDTNFSESSTTSATSVTVGEAPTTTTLGASTTSPVVGEQVTYTATVSPTPDGGSVTFYDGGNPITCTNSGGQTVTSGQATCEYTYETTSGSPHSITATYSGDTNFSESSTTSATSVTVGEAPTTTTLGASTTSPVVGEQVTYTATVSPTPDGGSVTFYDGGNPITCTNSGGQTVTSGQATCEYTYETTSGSPHSITATYSGDTNFSGSSTSASTTVTVVSASTTTTPSIVTSGPYTYGESITYEVAISPEYTGAPTGTVQVLVGSTEVCTVSLNSSDEGSGDCTSTSAAAGNLQTVTANYLGDSNFAASSGTASETLSITKAPLTITASSPTITYGDAVPAISPSFSGFVNGDTASSLSPGPTCSVTGLPSGNTAGSYTTSCGGAVDTNYTITYSSGTLTISEALLTITANPATRSYGQSNTSFTVSYSGFVNGDGPSSLTGTLECSTGATVLSTVGDYPITCTGLSSPNYAITWQPGTLTVTKAATATAPSVDPTSSTSGQSVTYSATVSSVGGIPAGTVSLSYGASLLCTIPALTAGTGSCSATDAPVGADTITAT